MGFDNVDIYLSRQLHKRRFNKTQTGNTFAHRIINHWNKLPENVVRAPSINTYKNRYDNHMAKLEMEAGNMIYIDH